jgi:hypothetical protein
MYTSPHVRWHFAVCISWVSAQSPPHALTNVAESLQVEAESVVHSTVQVGVAGRELQAVNWQCDQWIPEYTFSGYIIFSSFEANKYVCLSSCQVDGINALSFRYTDNTCACKALPGSVFSHSPASYPGAETLAMCPSPPPPVRSHPVFTVLLPCISLTWKAS